MKSRHFKTNTIILMIYFFQSESTNLMSSDCPITLWKEMLQVGGFFLKLCRPMTPPIFYRFKHIYFA